GKAAATRAPPRSPFAPLSSAAPLPAVGNRHLRGNNWRFLCPIADYAYMHRLEDRRPQNWDAISRRLCLNFPEDTITSGFSRGCRPMNAPNPQNKEAAVRPHLLKKGDGIVVAEVGCICVAVWR